MRAKDVMSMEVVTIDAKATLLEAVTLLINSQESALPVLDDGDLLVGIVSEFDLIRHVMGSDAGKLANFQSQLEKGGDLDDAYSHALKARVTTIMTAPVITAQEDSELQAVADLILAHQVQRIPILRGTSLVGIVRRGDLMKALLSRPGAGPLRRRARSPTTSSGKPWSGRSARSACRSAAASTSWRATASCTFGVKCMTRSIIDFAAPPRPTFPASTTSAVTCRRCRAGR